MPRFLSHLLSALLLGLPVGGLGFADGASAATPWLGQTVWVAPDLYTQPPVDAGVSPPLEGTDPSAQRGVDPARAAAFFAAAQDAAQQGRLSEAFALATRTLHADPAHAEARAVLGYEEVDGEWLTPYQARQRRRGLRWDPRFGWLRADEVARYEAGERRDGRRWVSLEEDAADHADIDDGWTVRTDHFAVTTNHSLQAGARLAAELEGLFQVWRQWFGGYWLTDREARALFAGERSARKRSRPMRVFYHRDKAGYVEHLRRRQPRIAQTLGIYFDDAREAHFYAAADGGSDNELARATLYHEAAHQLFAENGPGRRGAGRDANFWLVEGVACYFELLAPTAEAGRYTLGNPAQGRLPSAVVDGPAAPLAELAPLGQTDLQRRSDLPAVYAQATGLVAMLRHGEHADADREALVATLREVYSGQPDGDELPRQVGRSAGELDQQYRRFLANLSR